MVCVFVCVRMCACVGAGLGAVTHGSLTPLFLQSPPESEELFVLPRDEVHSSVLQQRGEDEQQTHRHPDIYRLHIGHLQHTHTHTD